MEVKVQIKRTRRLGIEIFRCYLMVDGRLYNYSTQMSEPMAKTWCAREVNKLKQKGKTA